jgi:hypothetical protein
VTFFCRHYTPLIVISDNIAENKGGALAEECRLRSVRQAYTCLYHPQQDKAEGYLGRITTMASFGMVLLGPPFLCGSALFAQLSSLITSWHRTSVGNAFGRLHTSYVMGKLFPDASVVVPFGCAALILLDQKDLTKFKSRCALAVFIHYADEHPLYTYAFYSPRTKRVLFRQDCIFLPTFFPMRKARQASGLGPDGEPVVHF